MIAPDPSWRERAALRVAEVGPILGCSRATCYEAVRAGQLPTIMVGGRLRVPVVALRRLLGELPEVAA